MTVVATHCALKFESKDALDALWIELNNSIKFVPDLEDQALHGSHLSFHCTIDFLDVKSYFDLLYRTVLGICKLCLGKERIVDGLFH